MEIFVECKDGPLTSNFLINIDLCVSIQNNVALYEIIFDKIFNSMSYYLK